MKPFVASTTSMAICSLAFAACADADDTPGRNAYYVDNRPPLVVKPYTELPLGAVKPAGWLRHQLERMADGMTGHLDELYPEVLGPRNGWLGGDGDGWERGPYWIDGLLPLAYLIDDETLIAKTRPWVEWTLTHQAPDGYLGPVPFDEPPPAEPGLQKDRRRDWWPKMVMLKILMNYYAATGDPRVIDCLSGYFHYQLRELPKTPIDHWTFWGRFRGGDNLLAVLWLYNVTGDRKLLELAELIAAQTYPWTEEFSKPDGAHTQIKGLHCVNLAQGIKEPIVYYQLDIHPRHVEAVRKAFGDIRRFHGMPHGLYGGDEPLSGTDPVRGSEFCSAVEMMFSLEKMLAVTGDVFFADRLERVAFNVLPTQAADDCSGRQYYCLVNQVTCARRDAKAHFTDHGGTDLVYGVLTGYPCCTTNFHQGWPKFTQHLWMATADEGLAALVYAPSSVTAKVAGGGEVRFVETTDYPFDETVRFTCACGEPAEFGLHLRIPSWCKGAVIAINGRPHSQPAGGEIVVLDRRWSDGDEVELRLPMAITADRWHNDSVAVERGPLVYALRIGEDWRQVDRTDHYGSYRECYPTDSWNYGLPESSLEDLDEHFRVARNSGTPAENPWNLAGVPIRLETTGKRIAAWQVENKTAGPLPQSPVDLPDDVAAEPIVLVPFGATTLRIAEFPVVR